MITINTALGADEVEIRLQELLSSVRDGTGRFSRVIGRVSDRKFELMRSDRLANSIFRPQFSGSIQQSENGSCLSGDFNFAKGRAVMRSWFAALAVWFVASIVVAMKFNDSMLWLLPACGLVFAFLGAAFFRLAQFYYRDDKEWLLRLISERIRGTQNSP